MEQIDLKDIEKLKLLAEECLQMSATMCKITALMKDHFGHKEIEEQK